MVLIQVAVGHDVLPHEVDGHVVTVVVHVPVGQVGHELLLHEVDGHQVTVDGEQLPHEVDGHEVTVAVGEQDPPVQEHVAETVVVEVQPLPLAGSQVGKVAVSVNVAVSVYVMR